MVTAASEMELFLPKSYDIFWSLVILIIVAVFFYKFFLPKFQAVFDERGFKPLNYHLSSVSKLFCRLLSCRLSQYFSAFQYLVLEAQPYKVHSNQKSLSHFRVTYILHSGQILVG